MEAIPRKYGEWGQFDRYCKLVLYHEAIDYLREMKCRRDREVSLDAVSPADWDKLSTVDRYSCDSFTFSSHGYDLHIDNELVAEAFARVSTGRLNSYEYDVFFMCIENRVSPRICFRCAAGFLQNNGDTLAFGHILPTAGQIRDHYIKTGSPEGLPAGIEPIPERRR